MPKPLRSPVQSGSQTHRRSCASPSPAGPRQEWRNSNGQSVLAPVATGLIAPIILDNAHQGADSPLRSLIYPT